MRYKTFHLAIVARLLIFTILAGSAVYFYTAQQWALMGSLIFFLFISGGNILYFMDSVNRELTFFFDAIRNEDTTLRFKEDVRNKSLRELHKSMNKVNRLISEIKVQNEHNEKFFCELLKHSATGLMAVDTQGYIEVANDSALRLMGLPHVAHIRLLQQKNESLYQTLLNILPGQTHTIKLLDGAELRLISVKVAVLLFGQKKYRVYSLHDIKTEMEENQLDTWQKLIRVLTHEIMNSVAPITSLSNTLTRFFKDNGKDKAPSEITETDISNTLQGLSVIEERGRGMMHFVDDYRALTKIPKPVFEKTGINEWLDSNCLLLKNRLDEENIHLEIIKENKQKSFIGDKKLLSQVLINLVNNAMDAVQENQEKTIRIKIIDNPMGNHIIHVIDNGKGIRANDLEKIFIPFFTTKESGSGIGLSLSQQIMRLHKGSISVQSIPGKQTVFSLKF